MKNIFSKRTGLIALIILAILSVAASPAAGSISKFRAVFIESTLQVLGASTTTGVTNTGAITNTGNFINTGTISQTGDSTFTGAVSVTGNATTGALDIWTAGSVITVTNSVPITATASYQPIASAGTVGTTVAVLAAGTRVCLVNTVNQTITITDTSTTMLSGNISLGQYDTLCLISDGTNMLELSTSNN